MAVETCEFTVFENEGQKIYGMIHLPSGKKRVPGVVMCHGFAGNRIGKYRIYILLARRLAEAGIASLRFDFRGSGESEGNLENMTVESEVSDTLKALEYLRGHPRVDGARTGVLGNSFGGAVAVLAAQQDPQVKSVAVLASLYSSQGWLTLWNALKASKDEKALRELARIQDGHQLGEAFYSSFFNLNLEKPLKELKDVPLLHIHSLNDDRVGMEHAEGFEQARKEASAETRWVRLNKCNHDFSNAEERELLIDECAKWFAKTL